MASALGENTNLTAFAWRVIFVVTTLVHGIGFLAYLAVWALTPYNQEGLSPIERILKAFRQSYDTIRQDGVSGHVARNTD